MDMSLSKFQEMVKDREPWCATVRGATRSQTWLSDWTTTIISRHPLFCCCKIIALWRSLSLHQQRWGWAQSRERDPRSPRWVPAGPTYHAFLTQLASMRWASTQCHRTLPSASPKSILISSLFSPLQHLLLPGISLSVTFTQVLFISSYRNLSFTGAQAQAAKLTTVTRKILPRGGSSPKTWKSRRSRPWE